MVNVFTLKIVMANPNPVFNALEIATLAVEGGYSNLVPMSEATNVLLLSALPFIQNRRFWETPQKPITDALWDTIIQGIDDATNELMTNLAIGSFFYSLAILTDPSVIIPVGQTIAQSDYPDFTAVVPANWIVGSDIQLPDMRMTFLTSATVPSDIGQITGSNEHTLTESEMPNHNHTQNPHTHGYTSAIVTPTLSGVEPIPSVDATPTPAITNPTTATNNPTGGGQPHNNVPLSLQLIPYIVVR